MASDTAGIWTAVSESECLLVGGEEYWHEVSQYVGSHKTSPNTKLFSFLALLNTYVSESYLLQSQCQKILGPPDPIHGGPPFEERMKPFSALIKTFTPSTGQDQHVCIIHPVIAQKSLQLLSESGVTRSTTVKTFMVSLGGDQAEPCTVQFIRDLLTKREMGQKGKEKFSNLINDIKVREKFQHAISVLSIASEKFPKYPLFPQTLSRLFLVDHNYGKAMNWAVEGIRRAPKNSYVADTLGQVHKNRLRTLMVKSPTHVVLGMAEEALKQFQKVEEKAKKEVGSEMEDMCVASISTTFNNRGLFGYIQVAKIIMEKLRGEEWRKILTGEKTVESIHLQKYSLISNLKFEVQNRYDFFEWYLAYSRPDIKSLEPPYFWKDVVLCYLKYTTKLASQSTSFPGLLDCLYHGLYTSRGSHAELGEAEKTVPDLKAIRDELGTAYMKNVADVEGAERYVLSNIILSNKMLNSPEPSLVEELKMRMHSFLVEKVGHRSPEFYLMVLLLFWPETQTFTAEEEEDSEVEEQHAIEADGSEKDKTWEDEELNDEEEPETGGGTTPPPLHIMMDLDLNQYVAFMKGSFDRKYAMYLRGRYLLPLFFLGNSGGLSRWVHKSRLDAILEAKVNSQDTDQQIGEKKDRIERKRIQNQIDEKWSSGEVWEIKEIQDILLPVRGEACSLSASQGQEEQEVFACIGGKRIKVTTEDATNSSIRNPMFFYLGFTIQGPVAFNVGPPYKYGL